MAKIRFTSIKPGLVFEHEGVKLKAVEKSEQVYENHTSCSGCFINYQNDAECLPCSEGFDKQKHNLIFKKIND